MLQVKQLPPAELARPWLPHHQPVHDALCPDLQFGVAGYIPRHVSADIPQIDGNELQTWSCIKGFEIQNIQKTCLKGLCNRGGAGLSGGMRSG